MTGNVRANIFAGVIEARLVDEACPSNQNGYSRAFDSPFDTHFNTALFGGAKLVECGWVVQGHCISDWGYDILFIRLRRGKPLSESRLNPRNGRQQYKPSSSRPGSLIFLEAPNRIHV